MCHTILRVTYGTNDTKDISVQEGIDVDNRIKDLQDNAQVNRIEIFSRQKDLRRQTVWEEHQRDK